MSNPRKRRRSEDQKYAGGDARRSSFTVGILCENTGVHENHGDGAGGGADSVSYMEEFGRCSLIREHGIYGSH